MNHPTWYWQYMRRNPKQLARSVLQTDCPAPDLWTRIVCRVLLGWKLVIVKPGHTPPPRGDRRGDQRDNPNHLRLQMHARRAAQKHYRQPPPPPPGRLT